MAAQKKPARIALQGELSVHNAAAIRKEMLTALSKSETVVVDFSALEDLDVSILQLFYALILEARIKNRTVCFEGAYSQAVKHCFAVSGFIASENIPDEQVYSQFAGKVGKKS